MLENLKNLHKKTVEMLKFLKISVEFGGKSGTAVRFFSESAKNAQQTTATASSSNLFKLRKSTGYALSKCKEALEKHSGDVEQVKPLEC